MFTDLIKAGSSGLFEFWFRREYESEILNKRLKSFVRPDDRTCPNIKYTEVGNVVNLRILDKPGTATSDPVLNSYVTQAIVKEISVKKICDMNASDFEGSAKDASDAESTILQLERIYNRSFTKDDIITNFKIEYVTNL